MSTKRGYVPEDEVSSFSEDALATLRTASRHICYLIDEGYDGEIVVKLFNHGDEDYQIRVGDKISQLVVLPVLYPEVVIVPHLVNGGPRGSHGFGSTGV